MTRAIAVHLILLASICAWAAPAGASAPAVEWEKIYGDTVRELATWIEEHSYNGYVVCGYAQPAGGLPVAFLMRLNSAGDTLWTRTYRDSLRTVLNCVRETRDRGYILGGYIERAPGEIDAWFVRTDAAGDTLWTSSFDFWQNDFIQEVEETDDGGFISAGFVARATPTATSDLLVLRLDSGGGGEWKLICGGPGQQRGLCMCRDANGDYVLAGYTGTDTAPADLLLLKLDGNDGDSVWARTYGDTATAEMGRSIRRSGDGLIVGGGLTNSEEGLVNGFLMRTDGNGDSLWTRTFGDTSCDLYLRSVRLTPDLGYICAAGLDTARDGNSDYYFIKTDSEGDTLWTKSVGGGARDYPVCIAATRDLGYAAVGYTRELTSADFDIYLVKLGVDDAGAGHVGRGPARGMLRLEGGSPFRDGVSVTYEMPAAARVVLSVFDIRGRLVAELEDGFREEGTHRSAWDCRDRFGRRVPAGVYFIRCATAGFSGAEKAVVLR